MTPAAATTPRWLERSRVGEAPDALPRGDHRRRGDHEDDEQTREVLDAAEAVGEAPRRRPARQREGDPQRDGRERVGQVVHGVGEQRDRAREDHDHALQHGGQAEDHEADEHRTDAFGARLERGVGGLGRVVAVRLDDVQQPPEQTVVVLMVVLMRRVRVRGGRGRARCDARARAAPGSPAAVGPWRHRHSSARDGRGEPPGARRGRRPGFRWHIRSEAGRPSAVKIAAPAPHRRLEGGGPATMRPAPRMWRRCGDLDSRRRPTGVIPPDRRSRLDVCGASFFFAGRADLPGSPRRAAVGVATPPVRGVFCCPHPHPWMNRETRTR